MKDFAPFIRCHTSFFKFDFGTQTISIGMRNPSTILLNYPSKKPERRYSSPMSSQSFLVLFHWKQYVPLSGEITVTV